MYAFAHIEKTAGTTINHVLRNSFGMSHCDVQPWLRHTDYCHQFYNKNDHKKILKLHPNLKCIAGHQVKPCSDLKKLYPDTQYFTFLRDPVERMISHYQYNIQKMGVNISFEKWAKRIDLHNFQVKHLSGTDSLEKAIDIVEKMLFIGLVEQFDESLIMLKAHIPELSIRKHAKNIASDPSIKEQLMNQSYVQEICRELNNKDIELYQYVTSVIYPRQQKQFGSSLAEEVKNFRNSEQQSTINIKLWMNILYRNIAYKPARQMYRFLNK